MTGGGFFDDFKNVWSRPNNAVAQLILINVIVFVGFALFMLFVPPNPEEMIFTRRYFGLPSNFELLPTRFYTFVTYMFFHSGFGHIFWNMIMFYWFGKLIQEFLGSQKVIGLYIVGGIAAGLTYVLAYNVIPLYSPYVEAGNLIGASGAVLAVVVGAATFMPNYTFFLFFIGPVRIKYIAMVFVFLSLLGTRGGNAGGEIAHLGGAAMGYIYITQLKKGNDLGKWVMGILNFFRSFFVRQPKIKVTHRSGNRRPTRKAEPVRRSAGEKVGAATQEEIDAILDKISQSGYESLTKEEKQKLFDASK